MFEYCLIRLDNVSYSYAFLADVAKAVVESSASLSKFVKAVTHSAGTGRVLAPSAAAHVRQISSVLAVLISCEYSGNVSRRLRNRRAEKPLRSVLPPVKNKKKI